MTNENERKEGDPLKLKFIALSKYIEGLSFDEQTGKIIS